MSRRKYYKGEMITSLDELAKQELVYIRDKITHRGWFGAWQLHLIAHYIENGDIYYAERIGDKQHG